MKLTTFFLTLLALGAIPAAQAQELPVGTIVPERITFTQGDPDSANRNLENLRLRNYRQFEGQVLMLVYHASW